MKFYITTITVLGAQPEVTRVVLGCSDPAWLFFQEMSHKLHGKAIVSFRCSHEPPARSDAEKFRADAFLDEVFSDKGTFKRTLQ